MILPNLIIPGAQKSGTSSLVRFIGAHPECVFSVPKEPTYFSKRSNLESLTRYAAHFAGADPARHKIIAEGTTAYMADGAVPALLYNYLGPNVKVLFILRDPIARAYSGYLHLWERGHERRTPDQVFGAVGESLSEAISNEANRLESASELGLVRHNVYKYPERYDDTLWQFRYLANSYYRPAVNRYRAVLGQENTHVVIFEQFIQTPSETADRISSFLGIDPSLFPEDVPHVNRSRAPGNNSAVRVLVRWMTSLRPGVAPVSLRAALMRIPPTMPKQLRARLRGLFAEERLYWMSEPNCRSGAQQWL